MHLLIYLYYSKDVTKNTNLKEMICLILILKKTMKIN